LRTALAMGADRAILIEATDNVQTDIELLAVAKLLAAVVGAEAPGLVLCDKQAIDNDMNATGQMLSAPLGWARGTFISELAIAVEHEEALFRHMERQVVAERLANGFMMDGTADVDGFLSFSLSVQNRRKSRAGWAFGHHVEAILQAQRLDFKREATTEKRNAADFLFPGEWQYADPAFPAGRLAMLAVKTTCKDRWRQVLAEANRIPANHLLTLEPAISETQTAEMQIQNLQLVLPAPLHATYREAQRGWLMSLRDFTALVQGHQTIA